MSSSGAASRSVGAWQALVAHDLKNALGTLEDRLAGLVAAPSLSLIHI